MLESVYHLTHLEKGFSTFQFSQFDAVFALDQCSEPLLVWLNQRVNI
jgi:hypothetical protein